MTRTCMDCPRELCASNASGRCRRCVISRHNRSPEHRERARKHMLDLRAAGLDTNREKATATARERAKTPEGRAQLLAASAKGMASWTPESRAAAAKKSGRVRHDAHEASLSWCPDDRREELARLKKAYGAIEGERLMRDDLVTAERRRLAAMTPHERAMERLANGAQLVAKPDLRRADHAFSLTGNATGML